MSGDSDNEDGKDAHKNEFPLQAGFIPLTLEDYETDTAFNFESLQSNDTELWLLRLPKDFDVQLLHQITLKQPSTKSSKRASAGQILGKLQIGADENVIHEIRLLANSANESELSQLQPLLPNRKKGCIQSDCKIDKLLSITRNIAMSDAPSVNPRFESSIPRSRPIENGQETRLPEKESSADSTKKRKNADLSMAEKSKKTKR